MHEPTVGEVSRETEILIEIKRAEKKAEDTIQRAKFEKETILRDAVADASKMMSTRQEELRKIQEKKLMDFKDKLSILREEKLAEGKNESKLLKTKSEKNILRAADFVMNQFEKMVTG